jgi:NADPH:quinone reductase-like Zn-dependent oxidoreductase
MATMKAVRIHRYGGSETLTYEDAPKPEPAADDILIRVHAASINPVDWKIRDGYGKEQFQHQMPLILGWDVAGTIEAVGADVNQFQHDDAVYGYISLFRNGAYAEYAIAKATELAMKPNSLNFVQAAALPVAALTALQGLSDIAGLTAKQRVLVHGASGGVGSIAVQIAKAKGAYVIGTASGRNADFVRKLGVDEFIDYQATPFETTVENVNIVFDTIGGTTQERSFDVLKTGGFLVSIVSPPSEELTARHRIKSGMVTAQPNGIQLIEINGLAETGKLRPYVETILPLNKAQQAQEMSQSGRTRGKIVLKIAD